jgi:hypothetical protein
MKSSTSAGPEPRGELGLIMTQIVRHTACPPALRNTRIGSCFVSPFQYRFALYQR